MNIAIIRFPGTNCEFDTEYAFQKLGAKTTLIWHKEDALPDNTDLVVLPGGFSYGDYLRSGAIARFSPIMNSIIEYANNGGKVLGICNGFQVLLEVNLLPGAMKHNENIHFVSKYAELNVVNSDNTFLKHFTAGDKVNIPIAHAEGNYYVDAEKLTSMEQNGQVLLRYTNNPNGSVEDIAGICNERKNVFGLMPHPERAIEDNLGSIDGINMLKGFLQ